MLQEYITYLIVGGAIAWAIQKIVKRFKKKSKQKAAKINFQKDNISLHDCGSCAASDCALRDLPKNIIKDKIDECNDNAIPLK